MALDDLVTTDIDDGVATVTLNRPEALNALSMALRNALTETFLALQDDASVRVVVLTGAGRAFTVGLDLKELGGETTRSAKPHAVALDDAMTRFDRPIIGAVNGFAITGGFEIALLCDILYASTEARFADTHARVGVVPGWGLSQRLPRLIGVMRAKELSLSGNFLDAQTAYEWGLVNRVFAPDALLPAAQRLARDILDTDTATRTTMHRIIDEGWHATLGEGLSLGADATRAHDARHKPASQVSQRRQDIQNRGRGQT